MSATIKLETHQVQIRKRGKPDDAPINLWNIDGKGLKFNDIFVEFITWLDTVQYANDEKKKVFAFDGKNAQMNQEWEYQTGQFEYGEYGVSNSIKNVRTKKVSHQKTGDESEVYPLYFLLYIPKGENLGVFVLQRYGHIAMLTQLKSSFGQFIREKYSEYQVSIEPLTPIEVIRGFIEKGTVEEITLKRFDLPTDDSERLKAGGLTSNPEGIIVKISGGTNLLGKEKLRQWLDEGNATFIVESLAQVGLDGNHKTTVKINVNGTPREIDFSDTGKIRPYIDIHDDNLLDKSSGHPIFEEINRIAKEYAKGLCKPDN